MRGNGTTLDTSSGRLVLTQMGGAGRPSGALTAGIPTTDTSGHHPLPADQHGADFTDFQCLTDPSGAGGTFGLMMWRDVSGGDGIQIAFDGFQIEATNGSICGDGAEECDDGNTAPGDGCDADCLDETTSRCAVAPILGCASAGDSSLSVVERTPGREKLKLALKKIGGAVPLGDLGDPVAGGNKPCGKAAGGCPNPPRRSRSSSFRETTYAPSLASRVAARCCVSESPSLDGRLPLTPEVF